MPPQPRSTSRGLFSNRTQHAEEENALTVALSRMRARGPVTDLTIGNPTTAGLPYPETMSIALDAEEAARARIYDPHPFGLLSAREAVTREYMEDGARVSPDDIFLTASTSEAYTHIFTSLCDAGDDVIVLHPSYPLFSYLALFAGVTLTSSTLAYDGAWHIVMDAVRQVIGPRTRGIMIVSPNNPTGSFLKHTELEALLDLGLPLIVDEVFSRYAFANDASRVATVAGATRGLVFSLGGLSKHVGLPQAKLSWTAISGDAGAVGEAKRRLSLVLDTYLSVGSAISHAAPRLLRCGHVTRDAIRKRSARNLDAAKRIFIGAAHPLQVEGGWYVTLRLPRTKPEETWALELLDKHALYTHPGAFFDFAEEAYLILSLLTPEEDFARGARIIADHVG
jgi:alanine-synthesizing transaminase